MATFIESSIFARACPAYLDDDEYAELQQLLLLKPEVGQVVAGSGGVRKLRRARPGMGKRGGLRVIYYGQVRAHGILDVDHLLQGQRVQHSWSRTAQIGRGFPKWLRN